MRAAVLEAPRHVRIEEVPVPTPGLGQIRVRVEGCGVCASNLPPFEGREWFTYPMEPGALGHEGWGVVDAVGSDETTFRPGDRVAYLSNNSYAEFDLAEASASVLLPRELEGQPFPGEPLGCAMNVWDRSNIGAVEEVAIIGVGFLGALLIQLATASGARVTALDRKPSALQIATDLGAERTLLMDDHWRVIEAAKEATGERLFPTVIEVNGKEWPLQLATDIIGEYGHLVIAGYHQDGMRAVNVQRWNWQCLQVTNAHERDPERYRSGMERAVTANLNLTPFLTHEFPLERLGEALEMAENRPEGFMKAWIRM